MKKKHRKKKPTFAKKLKKFLATQKIPKIRTGVQPTKIIRDKTKYSRKVKHKKVIDKDS